MIETGDATALYHHKLDVACSGDLRTDQSSWIETTVQGPGTITFWLKTAMESGCYTFSVDGQTVTTQQPNLAWGAQTYPVTGLGTHTLRWTYSKDGSGSAPLAGQNR